MIINGFSIKYFQSVQEGHEHDHSTFVVFSQQSSLSIVSVKCTLIEDSNEQLDVDHKDEHH